ncbi:MAG: hypothetical protein RMJ18_03330 [Candidatus Aenigmarchaeota archaeon]|nr:hypothetical protein [Candidatus Aenigmarchaeota archaeon]MDW8160417.1 hypothetical protein [Candidatus Aenigmarchaeota archaeon]
MEEESEDEASVWATSTGLRRTREYGRMCLNVSRTTWTFSPIV